MSEIGHNSQANGRLRSFIDRIERLNDDIAEVQADRKEVFAEAKSDGFNVAIIRKVLAIRKMDKAKREEQEALIDLYLTATDDLV